MEDIDKMNNAGDTNVIRIAADFSKYPAGRYRQDGPSSGEAFREDHLKPALVDPDVTKVIVWLDGVAGFGSSFLDEAFGGLVRACGFTKDFLDEHLAVETTEQDLKDDVHLTLWYIERAANEGVATG